jgi:hypothetical protein
MLKIGWKACPYCIAAIIKFTVRDVRPGLGWIERVGSLFFNLLGATSANSVTTVPSSFPRRNFLTPSAQE